MSKFIKKGKKRKAEDELNSHDHFVAVWLFASLVYGQTGVIERDIAVLCRTLSLSCLHTPELFWRIYIV